MISNLTFNVKYRPLGQRRSPEVTKGQIRPNEVI